MPLTSLSYPSKEEMTLFCSHSSVTGGQRLNFFKPATQRTALMATPASSGIRGWGRDQQTPQAAGSSQGSRTGG